MAASRGAQPSVSPVVVLLLLGEKLSGKSSVGNLLLGKQAFHKNTTRSSKQNGFVCGREVTVVDTPGWLSHSATPDKVSREIRRGLTLCPTQPHVLLLVVPATSGFSREAWRAMEAQLRLLQTPIWQRAVVLFTHGDQLGSVLIQEYIRRQGATLHWLLERCGNRFQVLTSAPQVAQLFGKIGKMMEVNGIPREIRHRMYEQLRRDLSRKEERRRQGGREEMEIIEMVEVHDGRPMFSGGSHLPRAGPVGFNQLEMGLVLLGRRKSGKSSAGNMILDRDEFPTDTKTTKCSVGRGMVAGRWRVTVVDTPGWSRFGQANPERVRVEVGRSASMCPAGSRVHFLLAVPVDSFTEKDRGAVETYLAVLGDRVWDDTMVLFTYGEELKGKTVERHIQKKGAEPLRRLLDRCGRRRHVFHTETGDRSEATQLLEMLEQI